MCTSKPCSLLHYLLLQSGILCLQVGIIRQVEVELDNTLRDMRDSHKEEAAKLRKWRALDKDVQAKLAELPIQGGLLPLLHIFTAAGAHSTACQLLQGTNIAHKADLEGTEIYLFLQLITVNMQGGCQASTTCLCSTRYT